MFDYDQFTAREEGDVTIVKFVDTRLLKEASIQLLGHQLFSMVEEDGRRELVLDFTDVLFLSSSMFGQLIRLDKKIKAAKGRLVFFGIRPEIYEVFRINKTYMLFEISVDEEAALQRIRGLKEKGLRLEACCPVHECGVPVSHCFVPQNEKTWEATLTCPKCAAHFTVHDGERISWLRFPTYEEEGIEVRKSSWYRGKARGAFRLYVRGRLDLFAAESLERAWLTIPLPRYAAVDLSGVTEVTDRGISILRRICRAGEEEGRCAVVVDQRRKETAETVSAVLSVYRTFDEAFEAIGEIPEQVARPFKIMVTAIREAGE